MSLNKRNNIKLEIKAPMTSVGTLLVVDKGTLLGEDFANDETKNFSLTLFKLEGDVPVRIEIAEVIAKSGNNLTLRRAVEPCPMNYGAGEMVQQAYDFDVGDVAYMNLTAGDIDEILEMIKDTNGRIDDVERDYVTQEQLELEKGTTIATLENGKIPGNQINTSTLEVTSLNQEFVAGEDIQAGYLVSFEGETPITRTPANTSHGFSGDGINSQSYTFTLDTLVYTGGATEIKLDITARYNQTLKTGYSTTYVPYFETSSGNIYANGFSANSEMLRTSQSSGGPTTQTYTYSIPGTNNYVLKCRSAVGATHGFARAGTVYLSDMKIYGYKKGEPNKIYIAKADNNAKKQVIGIATETKQANQSIKIMTNGLYDKKTNITPGKRYFLGNTGLLSSTGTIEIGYGITPTSFLLGDKKNNIVVVRINGGGRNTTYTHGLGVIPRIIYAFGNQSAYVRQNGTQTSNGNVMTIHSINSIQADITCDYTIVAVFIG